MKNPGIHYLPHANVIIFDLDGTLINSREGILNSVKYSLKKLGIEDPGAFHFERFIGPPIRDSFAKLYQFDSVTIEKAVEYYREYYGELGVTQNELYPGIPDLLKQLKDEGRHLFVATTKPLIFAERILKDFDIWDYFTDVMGSNLDGTASAKEEVIRIVMERNPEICYTQERPASFPRPEEHHPLYRAFLDEVKYSHIVMIGDRKYDVSGAFHNGIMSIGVTYGFGTVEEIASATPTYIVNSVYELAEIFRQP